MLTFVARLWTEKSKYHTTISRHAAPLCPIVNGKVEISQYYLTARCAFVSRLRTEKPKAFNFFFSSGISCLWHRKSRNITVLSHPFASGKVHGLSTFLAELVVFGIGKVEILQYYAEPTNSRALVTDYAWKTRPSKPCPRAFHFSRGISCLWHRKSRNTTVPSHPVANGKVEILQ